jgi:hypothetical protein
MSPLIAVTQRYKPMRRHLKFFVFALCVFAGACVAQAASPTLSISQIPPASLQFSWPSNFIDWQLTSAPNLSSATWQSVTQAPLALGGALVVLLPLTNKSGYFRLQQTNASSCVFQATPSVITAGASSTLSWCPTAGFTYRVTPGPGIVAGGILVVSPTVTTVYTLTASNAVGVVTNFTPVIVNPCGFASVSNWNATLNFSYQQTAAAPGFSFSVMRTAVSATFHLTNSGTAGLFVFDGIANGTISINDTENDSSSGTLITTKVVGTGPPVPLISTFVLSINCANGTYNFAAIAGVDGTETTIVDGISDSSPATSVAGQVAVFPRALPVGSTTLAGSATLPTTGPFTIPTSDYFTPNDFIANDMWVDGALTDATAAPASVSWSITPAP